MSRCAERPAKAAKIENTIDTEITRRSTDGCRQAHARKIAGMARQAGWPGTIAANCAANRMWYSSSPRQGMEAERAGKFQMTAGTAMASRVKNSRRVGDRRYGAPAPAAPL